MSVIAKTAKFTGGMLLGLGIGAATALLLAPQSGGLSRGQLQARLNEIGDAAKRARSETENELYSRWEAQMTEAHQDKKKADDPAEAARKAAEEARKREEARRKEAESHLQRAESEVAKAEAEMAKAKAEDTKAS